MNLQNANDSEIKWRFDAEFDVCWYQVTQRIMHLINVNLKKTVSQ